MKGIRSRPLLHFPRFSDQPNGVGYFYLENFSFCGRILMGVLLNLQAKRAMEFIFVTNAGGHSLTHIRVRSTDEPTRESVGKLKGISLFTQKVAPIQQFQMMMNTPQMMIIKPLVRIIVFFNEPFFFLFFTLFACWDDKGKEQRIEFRTLKVSMLSTLRQKKKKKRKERERYIKLSSTVSDRNIWLVQYSCHFLELKQNQTKDCSRGQKILLGDRRFLISFSFCFLHISGKLK